MKFRLNRALFYLTVLLGMTCNLMAGGNCSGTSTGLIPITQLTGSYLGSAGFLYDGSNERPQSLTTAAPPVSPINGKIVVAGMGMSNTWQDFGVFTQLASQDDTINPSVQFVNLAAGGCVARETADPNNRCWNIFANTLSSSGISFADVQVLWLKTTSTTRGTVFPESSQFLLNDLRDTLSVARQRMPNLKQVYVSSRVYAGYASVPLNPEPYSYETAFAFKELVRSQVPGLWISWGPYLWADGMNVRPDGLFWTCDDFQNDGTHPSNSGSLKVAHALLEFFRTDEVAGRWFLADGSSGPGPNPNPTPGAISDLVQGLLDDLNNRRTSLPEIVTRLQDIRDRLIDRGL